MSSTIDQYLDSITDESLKTVKNEFRNLFNQAKSEQEEFAKNTAKKIEKWLQMRIQNEIDNDELEALLNARKRNLRQNLNTLEIQSRSRLEKILFGIIDIVTNKLLDPEP